MNKPTHEGPAAYVLTSDERRKGAQVELLQVLQKQHVEISRATAPFSVNRADRGRGRGEGGDSSKTADSERDERQFPAGSYIIRMDQPYSRIADALLDYQYWSPNDPQKNPVRRHRMDVPRGLRRAGGARHRHEGARRADGAVTGDSPRRAASGQREPFRDQSQRRQRARHASLRFPAADFQVAEESFDAGGKKFGRGSFIVRGVAAATSTTRRRSSVSGRTRSARRPR